MKYVLQDGFGSFTVDTQVDPYAASDEQALQDERAEFDCYNAGNALFDLMDMYADKLIGQHEFDDALVMMVYWSSEVYEPAVLTMFKQRKA